MEYIGTKFFSDCQSISTNWWHIIQSDCSSSFYFPPPLLLLLLLTALHTYIQFNFKCLNDGQVCTFNVRISFYLFDFDFVYISNFRMPQSTFNNELSRTSTILFLIFQNIRVEGRMGENKRRNLIVKFNILLRTQSTDF